MRRDEKSNDTNCGTGGFEEKSLSGHRLHQYPVECGWTTPGGSPGS